jgi:hypothetical protein
MRRERRQPTRREWAQITSPGLVVRRIPKPPLKGVGQPTPSTSAPPFGPELTNSNEATMDTNTSEGER